MWSAVVKGVVTVVGAMTGARVVAVAAAVTVVVAAVRLAVVTEGTLPATGVTRSRRQRRRNPWERRWHCLRHPPASLPRPRGWTTTWWGRRGHHLRRHCRCHPPRRRLPRSETFRAAKPPTPAPPRPPAPRLPPPCVLPRPPGAPTTLVAVKATPPPLVWSRQPLARVTPAGPLSPTGTHPAVSGGSSGWKRTGSGGGRSVGGKRRSHERGRALHAGVEPPLRRQGPRLPRPHPSATHPSRRARRGPPPCRLPPPAPTPARPRQPRQTQVAARQWHHRRYLHTCDCLLCGQGSPPGARRRRRDRGGVVLVLFGSTTYLSLCPTQECAWWGWCVASVGGNA